VLYCDTDSLIYVQNARETMRIKRGENLGDLKSSWKSLVQAPISKSLSRLALKTMRFLSLALPKESEKRNAK
jgi:hypothetical protein